MTEHSRAIISLVNGDPADAVSIYDRGLNYGDGLFETILCRELKPVLFDSHIKRLLYGLRVLNIDVDEPSIHSSVNRLLKRVDEHQGARDGVLKLVVTRGVGGRGYEPPASGTRSTIVASWHDLPAGREQLARSGVSVKVCNVKLGLNEQLAGIKHLNRLEQVMAAAELLKDEYDEGLLLDQNDNIIEAISKNVFFVSKKIIYTPILKRAGVKGVMRGYIIDVVAPKLDLVVEERNIHIESLAHFTEAFLCNSVVGIIPIKKMAGNILELGAVTRLIQEFIARELHV